MFKVRIMEREHQGCLVGIGMLAVCGVVFLVAYKLQYPFFKFVCYLFPGLMGAYIGSQYFSSAEQRKKSRFPRRTWILLAIGYLVLAALLAWWLEGRLW